MVHGHRAVDSICPRCGRVNHVEVPVGERVVRVFCQHCTHGYEYTHVVMEHTVVDEEDHNTS